MRLIDRFREYLRRHNDLSAGRDPVWDDAPEYTPTQTMPAAAYEPHGIDSPDTLAEIVAQAKADADAAHESAVTEAWGDWDQPGVPLAPVAEMPPPPPMPLGSLSQVMVNQITYPDPADLSYDKDRKYRDLYKRTGVATGTRASQEDTGVWALPALAAGDGTGVQL